MSLKEKTQSLFANAFGYRQNSGAWPREFDW